MEEEPFNPDYVEVDRVLEVSYCEDKDTGEVKRIFFHLLIISVSSVSVCFICVYVPEHVLPFSHIMGPWSFEYFPPHE